MEPQPLPILILVKDLLFSSKITATAKSLDLAYHLVRDPAQLQSNPGRQLIVDLNLPGAIEAASAWMHATESPAIGFVSHVDADTIAKARDAGITQVLPRSAFVANLPELLQAGR